MRNEYRSATRKYMQDGTLAEYLNEVEKNREWSKYLEYVLKQRNIDGNKEKAFQKIIESSIRGREGVDDLFLLRK